MAFLQGAGDGPQRVAVLLLKFMEFNLFQRLMITYGEAKGLKAGDRFKALFATSLANVYGQILLERHGPVPEPSEAQLQALYAERAAGAGTRADYPAFDQVKAQLSEDWKKQQTEAFAKDLVAKARGAVGASIVPASH